MDVRSLEFQGTGDQQLLAMLLGAVVLILLAGAVWQFVRRNWRGGVLCLGGAFGPAAMLAVLLADAVRRQLAGDVKGGRASLMAAGGVLAGTLAGAWVVVYWGGGNATALWAALLGVEAAIAVGVFYCATYAHLGARRVAMLMALRCLAILALLLILFKPAISVTPAAQGFKPLLPILVDRSASMATVDSSGLSDRYSEALAMLGVGRRRLEEHFRPVYYHFARGPQMAGTLEALSQLAPRGEGTDATDIAAAIRAAGSRDENSSLAGIVLMSDGNHNGSSSPEDAAREAGVPIYTVGIGSSEQGPGGGKNIGLVSVDAPMEAVKNNVTTITARVRMTGFASIPGEIRLMEEGVDQPCDTQQLWTSKADDTLTIKLKWTPRDSGTGVPPVSPSAHPERKETEETHGRDAHATEDHGQDAHATSVRKLRVVVPPNPAETITDDNNADLHVVVAEPKIRVLYIEGAMRSEYKYLKRMLDTDQNVQFGSLVRVSGNSFWAQGSIGGPARGAAGATLDHVPSSDADFGMFDVLILGSLDRTFLTSEQMARIAKFVNDGGGLLMIGGQNSFGPGGFEGTGIEQVLPVMVGGRGAAQETTRFVPQLTAQGAAHPIFEGIADYFSGPGGAKPKEGLAPLPELLGCVAVASAKQGAATLAVHPTRSNAGGPLVVLAVQQFGAGRSAAFTPDTTWQWYLPLRSLGADSPYNRFWGQMVRWLANVQTKSRTASGSVLLRVDHSYMQIGQRLHIICRVQDAAGQLPADATVSCTITPQGTEDHGRDAHATHGQDGHGTDNGQAVSMPLGSTGSDGLYEGEFTPPASGKYAVKVAATLSGGKAAGEDELAVLVAPYSSEMQNLSRNSELLGKLSELSGGRYADIGGFADLVDQIIDRQKGKAVATPEPQVHHLYNFVLLFVIFAALVTSEWLLRRSWQLH
jgi:uncharacterized membrane protein